MCYVQVAYFYEAWCILKIRLQMFGIKSFNNDNVAVGQEQNDQTKVNQVRQIAYITFQNGTKMARTSIVTLCKQWRSKIFWSPCVDVPLLLHFL